MCGSRFCVFAGGGVNTRRVDRTAYFLEAALPAITSG